MLWQHTFKLLLLPLINAKLIAAAAAAATTITTPYCPENLTKVELLPILRNHVFALPHLGFFERFRLTPRAINVTYFEFKKNISFKILNKCCTGYRMTLYGICAPICDQIHCDAEQHQLCVEPNRCGCKNGYKYNATTTTHCAPICKNGCQLNAYCSAPNICECMANYTLNAKNGTCQARCRPGIEWDPLTMQCVQKLQANVAVIAAEMDIELKDALVDEVTGGDSGGRDRVRTFGTVGNFISNCTKNDQQCGARNWPKCFYISIGIGVVFLLLALVIVAQRYWRNRNNEQIVLLEPKIDFFDDYGLERNQILVY